MFVTDDKDHLVESNTRAGEFIPLDHPFNEAQFDGAGFHSFRNLGRISNRQSDIEPRIGSTKCDKVPRQPIARNCLAGLHRERSAIKAPKLAQGQFGAINPRQDRLSFGKKYRARLRQFDPASHPIKKSRVVPCFECCDRMAGGRLGEIQRSGRLRHVLPLRDRYENPELLKRHDQPPHPI